ncbi:protein extra-macrochaetae-like isoform X2 [Macrobrachium nipponense]|uniref:protein extra-macrochaetae-like isoform X2 n=1 Tax=Macrobrachium nipponense TaxID=159736 RepID=UPI0030C7C3DF
MMRPTHDDLSPAVAGGGGGGVGVGGGGMGVNERGRRSHRHPPSGEVEAEMRLYLDKLREIVPHIPRNRKVTRLELIQHVIDYICDLQHALEDHPGLKDEPTARLLTPPMSPMSAHGLLPPTPHPNLPPMPSLNPNRQPLGVLSTPNTLQTPNRRDVTKTTSRLTSPIPHTLPGST